jgi:hypothetical protein
MSATAFRLGRQVVNRSQREALATYLPMAYFIVQHFAREFFTLSDEARDPVRVFETAARDDPSFNHSPML